MPLNYILKMVILKHSINEVLGSCAIFNKNSITNIQSKIETNQDILSVQVFKSVLTFTDFYVHLGQICVF